MSNIYIQEPPTCGKVLLTTTVGDIDIELWAKETPKACRNFIQLVMEGYYNGTIFHRIVKGFIAQGGDPTGTGSGGESIYGHPFKDEFHSRLRFSRRGLVAMANSEKDDNGSQFFFTFAACPELQNKHTIFGKVTGETIYNMIKLEEAETDDNETPLYPPKILKAEILSNPFNDIIPRCLPEKKEKKKKTEKKKAGIKNFNLLSFGEEAAEDEEESKEVSLSLAGKSKSTHDALNDPKLSSVPVVEKTDYLSQDENSGDDDSQENKLKAIDVKNKLKKRSSESISGSKVIHNNSDNDEEYNFKNEEIQKKKKRLQEIAEEIKALKADYKKNKKQNVNEKNVKNTEDAPKEHKKNSAGNELIDEYKSNLEKYRLLSNKIAKKGSDRESQTLEILAGFKKRIQFMKDKMEENESDVNMDDVTNEDDQSWLVHKLNFKDESPVLAKDANMKSDDWFDITDPRNPINKRRREQSKANTKK